MATLAGKPGGFTIITGVDDLKDALSRLGGADVKSALRKGLREGAKVIRDRAKELAPVDTGQLRKSIKVRAARGGPARVGMRVITGKGDYKGDEFYASFIEYGHRRGKRPGGGVIGTDLDTREEVPARPFMRPAFDEKKEAAIAACAQAMREAIAAITRGK